MYEHSHIDVYTFMCVYVYIYIHTHIYMYIFICVCVYIYTHSHIYVYISDIKLLQYSQKVTLNYVMLGSLLDPLSGHCNNTFS